MTETRRAARGQDLPQTEVTALRSLGEGIALYIRCRNLYEAGWTLRAIGDALDPKRPRSTVRTWVTKEFQYGTTLYTQYNGPLPIPELATPAHYEKKTPPSPGISPSDLDFIAAWAPEARKYRSGMPSSSEPALDNVRLTELVLRLHEEGVPVRELANAAGVTYRAMARRLGKLNK